MNPQEQALLLALTCYGAMNFLLLLKYIEFHRAFVSNMDETNGNHLQIREIMIYLQMCSYGMGMLFFVIAICIQMHLLFSIMTYMSLLFLCWDVVYGVCFLAFCLVIRFLVVDKAIAEVLISDFVYVFDRCSAVCKAIMQWLHPKQ